MPPRLRLASRAMSAVVGVQALLGISLAISGDRPADWTHFIFGPLTLLVLPVAVRVSARREGRAAASWLLGGWTALLLLTLRAVGTGGLS